MIRHKTFSSECTSYDAPKEHCNSVSVSADNCHRRLAHKLAAISVHWDAGNGDTQANLKPKYWCQETINWTEESGQWCQLGLLSPRASWILRQSSAVSTLDSCRCHSSSCCYRSNGQQLWESDQVGWLRAATSKESYGCHLRSRSWFLWNCQGLLFPDWYHSSLLLGLVCSCSFPV